MLHAPTSETKTEIAQSKSQLAPQPERELHPRLLSAAGPYSSSGMNGVASGASPEAQRRQAVAGMQATHGNQAVLRMLHSPQQVARMTTLRPSQGIMLQRKCACGGSSETEGECTECKAKGEGTLQRRAANPTVSPAAGAIQTKLAINKPGDQYEQEADRVSEQVMRMPESQLQRACACGGSCSDCQTEQPEHGHERLQAKRVQASDTGQIAAPPIVHEVLRSPGQPLDPEVRAFMEPRFGYDFSRVRVHSGAAAERSAGDVNAHAYTVGHDMVFGTGWFAPGTHQGRRLIAHELTHVVQQSAGHAPGTVARQPVDAGLLQRKDEEKAPPKAPQCFTGCGQRWGKNTTCSRWGFQLGVHEREPQFIMEVKGKKLKPRPCCNSWPWSLEDYARRHLGLNGAASCPAQFGQEIATITTLDGKKVQVLCSDTITPAKVLMKEIDRHACDDDKFKADGGELIEMSPKAMLRPL